MLCHQGDCDVCMQVCGGATARSALAGGCQGLQGRDIERLHVSDPLGQWVVPSDLALSTIHAWMALLYGIWLVTRRQASG